MRCLCVETEVAEASLAAMLQHMSQEQQDDDDGGDVEDHYDGDDSPVYGNGAAASATHSGPTRGIDESCKTCKG